MCRLWSPVRPLDSLFQVKVMFLVTCSGRRWPWLSPVLTFELWPTVTCTSSNAMHCRKFCGFTRPLRTTLQEICCWPTTWGKGWVKLCHLNNVISSFFMLCWWKQLSQQQLWNIADWLKHSPGHYHVIACRTRTTPSYYESPDNDIDRKPCHLLISLQSGQKSGHKCRESGEEPQNSICLNILSPSKNRGQ